MKELIILKDGKLDLLETIKNVQSLSYDKTKLLNRLDGLNKFTTELIKLITELDWYPELYKECGPKCLIHNKIHLMTALERLSGFKSTSWNSTWIELMMGWLTETGRLEEILKDFLRKEVDIYDDPSLSLEASGRFFNMLNEYNNPPVVLFIKGDMVRFKDTDWPVIKQFLETGKFESAEEVYKAFTGKEYNSLAREELSGQGLRAVTHLIPYMDCSTLTQWDYDIFSINTLKKAGINDSRIYALVDRIFEMSEKEYKEIYDKIVDIPIYRLNYNRIKKIMEGAE